MANNAAEESTKQWEDDAWSGWRGRWDGWGWDHSDGWGSQWRWRAADAADWTSPSSERQSSPAPEPAAVEPAVEPAVSEPVRPWWMDSPVPDIPSPQGQRLRRWGSSAEQPGYADGVHSQVSQEVAETTPSSAAQWLTCAPTPAPAPAPTPPSAKIVVLGMPKCGTTSLHESFKRAGFRSVHWALDAGQEVKKDTRLRLYGEGADERLLGRLIAKAVERGLPPFALLPEKVDALAEMNGCHWTSKQKDAVQAYFPQMQYLREICDAYPDARFILNTRNLQDWVKSVDKHNDMRERLIQADLPGLPKGMGERDEDLIEWVSRHHERVAAQLMHRRLLKFNIDVHGAAELSAFLGRRMEWPHFNATKH